MWCFVLSDSKCSWDNLAILCCVNAYLLANGCLTVSKKQPFLRKKPKLCFNSNLKEILKYVNKNVNNHPVQFFCKLIIPRMALHLFLLTGLTWNTIEQLYIKYDLFLEYSKCLEFCSDTTLNTKALLKLIFGSNLFFVLCTLLFPDKDVAFFYVYINNIHANTRVKCN